MFNAQMALELAPVPSLAGLATKAELKAVWMGDMEVAVRTQAARGGHIVAVRTPHPEILEELTEELEALGFDLHYHVLVLAPLKYAVSWGKVDGMDESSVDWAYLNSHTAGGIL
jgi:hypothetical protein